MKNKEWPAEDYAIGSFIQAKLSDIYLVSANVSKKAHILDVGCGDGAYSKKLVEKIPKGEFTGIDASKNMLKLAHDNLKHFPRVTLKNMDVKKMSFDQEFDWVFSFWCLQWVKDIPEVFKKIAQALKPKGQFLAIFPYGDDPYPRLFSSLKASGKFPVLNHFHSPIDYDKLRALPAYLSTMPFDSFSIERRQHTLELDSLDTFRKFVNGISFFQGQVSQEELASINEAMVREFDEGCKREHGGRYCFVCSFYVVKAIR